MKIFRRASKKNADKPSDAASQSVVIPDNSGLNDSSLVLDPNGPATKEQVGTLLKRIKTLNEQNNHLNKYIGQLVKENESLQSRLEDMKVTLAENKAMMEAHLSSAFPTPKKEEDIVRTEPEKVPSPLEPVSNDANAAPCACRL